MKISVIIPVYKAEAYLRKCVESILLGEERDLEVILVEDHSGDGSWKLCQQLAEEYDQVRCLRNEQNRGVSYTRNRGLDAATGRYVLFVDSDDWVSGSYAKTLIETQEANPGKLVVCGYTFVDQVSQSRRVHPLPDASRLKKRDFFTLTNGVLLQQLWNKVFSLQLIREAGIRFDETISMGEDYQFVLDVLEASETEECVIIQKPLYYYVRRNNQSLMSTWSASGFSRELRWLERLSRICGYPDTEAQQLDMLRNRYLYAVATDRRLSGRTKRQLLKQITNDHVTLSCRLKQWKVCFGVCIGRFKSTVGSWLTSVRTKQQIRKNLRQIRASRKRLHRGDISVISRDAIGGVFCHDMNRSYLSPTVGLRIPPADFIRFVSNLEHYLNIEPVFRWGEDGPVGMLADVELLFVNYDTCQQAREAWKRRKKRVKLSNVLVLSTDRDGFDEAVFAQWRKLPYPKLLFTARQEFADHPDSLYFPEYQQSGCVPDLIINREFYKDDRLLRKANQVAAAKR